MEPNTHLHLSNSGNNVTFVKMSIKAAVILCCTYFLAWERLQFPVFYVQTSSENRRFFLPGGDTSATIWPEVGYSWLPQSKNKFRQKNGGPQESLSWVFALSCQHFTKTVISGEAFHPPVHTYSGLRRSHDPLGCHRGRENTTTSMTVNVS